MKYSWKGHKDRNRHKNRIKRSRQEYVTAIDGEQMNSEDIYFLKKSLIGPLQTKKWVKLSEVAEAILKFHCIQRSAPSESHINLWSMRLTQQQSKNSAAAQPLIEIKRYIPKQFSVNLWFWQTYQTSCRRAALRAEGRKTEDWRQQF